MKQAAALVAIASIMFLAACARQSPATARNDQFPMARGPYFVKAIAILCEPMVFRQQQNKKLKPFFAQQTYISDEEAA